MFHHIKVYIGVALLSLLTMSFPLGAQEENTILLITPSGQLRLNLPDTWISKAFANDILLAASDIEAVYSTTPEQLMGNAVVVIFGPSYPEFEQLDVTDDDMLQSALETIIHLSSSEIDIEPIETSQYVFGDYPAIGMQLNDEHVDTLFIAIDVGIPIVIQAATDSGEMAEFEAVFMMIAESIHYEAPSLQNVRDTETISVANISRITNLQTLDGHEDSLLELQYSANGQYLVSGGGDGQLIIWDVTTGESHLILGTEHMLSDVAINPSVEVLAYSDGGEVYVFDVSDTSSPLFSSRSFSRVTFSPDGTVIAIGGVYGGQIISNDGSFRIIRTFGEETFDIQALAFSPDGLRLAGFSFDLDADIYIWDAISGEQLDHMAVHTSFIDDLRFSPDGTLLASASWDGTARVWNTISGEELFVFQSIQQPGYMALLSVAFSADGQLLAIGSSEDIVRIIDLSNGEIIAVIQCVDDVNSLDFSPDGKQLAIDSGNGPIQIWGVYREEP